MLGGTERSARHFAASVPSIHPPTGLKRYDPTHERIILELETVETECGCRDPVK